MSSVIPFTNRKPRYWLVPLVVDRYDCPAFNVTDRSFVLWSSLATKSYKWPHKDELAAHTSHQSNTVDGGSKKKFFLKPNFCFILWFICKFHHRPDSRTVSGTDSSGCTVVQLLLADTRLAGQTSAGRYGSYCSFQWTSPDILLQSARIILVYYYQLCACVLHVCIVTFKWLGLKGLRGIANDSF